MLPLLTDIFLFVLIIGGLALPYVCLANRYDPLERIGLGLGASLVTIYLFATLLYLVGADSRWHWLLPFLGLLGVVSCRREMVELRNNPTIREAGLGWLLLATWCLAFVSLITSYAGGSWAGDWFEHYERALFYLEHWPADYRFITVYPLPARPPLANLVTNALLALGNADYTGYQIFTSLLCTLTYFPLLAICRLFGGQRMSALLLAPALMLNPCFLQNTSFAWTKLPAAFFVLLAVPLLVRSLRDPTDNWHLAWASAFLAAGMLAHYSAAVWMIAFLAGWLTASLGSRTRPAVFFRLSSAGLTATLLLATWFGWALIRYGPGLTFGSNSTVDIARQSEFGEILSTFGQGVLRTIVPHPLLGTHASWLAATDSLAATSDWFFHLYQETIPLTLGGAGLVLLCMVVFRTSASPDAPGNERVFWWLALVLAGLLGIGSVTIPCDWGLAQISLQPMVLLGLTWLVVKLPEIWRSPSRWMRSLLLALGLFDFVCGIVIHFAVQYDAATRFSGLSFAARTNYAGKLRLGQPFLADTLMAPGWIIALILVTVFALACWRISTQRPTAGPVQRG